MSAELWVTPVKYEHDLLQAESIYLILNNSIKMVEIGCVPGPPFLTKAYIHAHTQVWKIPSFIKPKLVILRSNKRPLF